MIIRYIHVSLRVSSHRTKMKYLVVGDPHYKDTNTEETEILELEVTRLVTELQPDKVVLLGDLLDKYKLRSYCRAVSWLYKLAGMLPVVVLIGNHDRVDNQDYLSDVHPLTGIRGVDNLVIISKVTMIDDALFVPYVPKERFFEAITTCDIIEEPSVIFAHQDLQGCGVSVEETWTCATLVVSGHIHTRTLLQDGKRVEDLDSCNVYYPGAPLQHNFNDSDHRVVALITTFDGQATISEHKLYVPTKRVITITQESDLSSVTGADKYTRIDVVGSTEECLKLKKSKQVTEAQLRGVVIKTMASAPEQRATKEQSFLVALRDTVLRECGEESLAFLDEVVTHVSRESPSS